MPTDTYGLQKTTTDITNAYIYPYTPTDSYRHLQTFKVTHSLLHTSKFLQIPKDFYSHLQTPTDFYRHQMTPTDTHKCIQTPRNAYRQLHTPPNKHRYNQAYIDSYKEPYMLQIPMGSYRHLQSPIDILRHPQTPINFDIHLRLLQTPKDTYS